MPAIMCYNIIGKIPFTFGRKIVNMDKRTLRRFPLNTDDVIGMYNNGIATTTIADKYGCSLNAVINCLKRNGVYGGRYDWESYIRRTYGVEPADLLHMYKSGMWKNEIAKVTGISEGAVGKYLEKLGIPIANNRSDAMKNRIDRMTTKEIKELTKPAHDAVRGMKRTNADLAKRARGKEKAGKLHGKAEKDLYWYLVNLGIKPIPQKAIWIYNIDLMIGNVAVEVTGRGRKRANYTAYIERTKYLLNKGLALIYVWANSAFPIEIGAAEYIVSFCDRVSSNPSMLGKYWVIRRDGKLMTSGGSDDNEFAGILTPVRGTYART